ncbi:ImmA/IrrE family metallo-endopeptidase [Candidatus Poribacteria bacterium]|nr:ImmA/IrrE family metallo-endopeptidase [Candidatus Poribacteria bacterium]
MEAECLLRELGINTLPIDPFVVADLLDIDLRPLPASNGGVSGMLLHVNGEFGIAYPTHIKNEGFKRFSLAHEIGHYRLPGHIDAVLDANGQHISKAGFRSTDRYEQEADHFASALLMPKKLFIAAMRSAGDGLQAIETLQEKCETSLESTAIRYVQTSRNPVVVIRSGDRAIDYAVMSDRFKEFPGLDWIRKGMPLPPSSITASFNANRDNITRGKRVEGEGCLQDWFNGPHRQEIIEEVVGLGSYGKTLTVLTGMEHPDEVEDDETELVESWDVRFRR